MYQEYKSSIPSAVTKSMNHPDHISVDPQALIVLDRFLRIKTAW